MALINRIRALTKLFSAGITQKTATNLNRNGFSYLLALMMVMVMGIMLGAIGQSWKTIMQREREEELLFRGCQYRDAIKRWYNRGRLSTPLKELKDLTEDPNSLTKIHYLRRLYTDPMTGKEWAVFSDPNKGISGVASTSQAKPLKIGGFPEDLKYLAGKEHYSDWIFGRYSGAGNAPGVITSGSTLTSGSTR